MGDMLDACAELMPGKENGAAAAGALESDVGSDSRHLPLPAATRMGLAQSHKVSGPYHQVLWARFLLRHNHPAFRYWLISSRNFKALFLAASAKSVPFEA